MSCLRRLTTSLNLLASLTTFPKTHFNPLTKTFFKMTSTTSQSLDPSTVSNYNDFRTKHIIADLAIDFASKRLKGNVTLQLEVLSSKTNEILLDTSHLDLTSIQLNGEAAKWDLRPRKAPLGSPLSVKTGSGMQIGKMIDVKVGSCPYS